MAYADCCRGANHVMMRRACLWLLVGWAASCAREPPLGRQLVTPDRATQLSAATSPILKAHLKDGRLYVFDQWQFDPKSRVVTGHAGVLGIDRGRAVPGTYRLPLDEVALFETNAPIRGAPALAAMAVVTAISVGVTAVCLLNPKACFGSCPTFYTWDGQRMALQAEGFSDSIAPALEDTDIDALYRTRPSDRSLLVRMTNEALETHVVKRVQILTVPRPTDGGRVFYAAGDGFYSSGKLRPPDRCTAPEGPCEVALRSFDGNERSSLADAHNLATREELTLQFAEPPSGRPALVIAARQTLLTTFLLYQGLAYLGSQATAALSELERDPSLRKRVNDTHHLLGGIEVQVRPSTRGGRVSAAGGPGDGDWKTVGEVFETGPIATDVHLVHLPPLPPGSVQVRLRMTRGDWRIDWVALTEVNQRIEPGKLNARSITGTIDEGRQNVDVQPGTTIVTLPGDTYELNFELPEHPERYELFLSSTGYYLEWIREQWLAEESRSRAAMMLYTPSLALRMLAPAYKRQEPDMERLFWGSRYARP